MSTTSTSGWPHGTGSVSVDMLEKLKKEIAALPERDQWIVIDPQGRMYKGTVTEVTRVLLSEHPMLKSPPVIRFDAQEKNDE